MIKPLKSKLNFLVKNKFDRNQINPATSIEYAAPNVPKSGIKIILRIILTPVPTIIPFRFKSFLSFTSKIVVTTEAELQMLVPIEELEQF